MRVALVCGRFRPDLDGVAGYVERLAAALPAAGVEPVVAAAGDVGAGGVRLAARWDVAGTTRAAAVLRRLSVDVVHVQFAPSAYAYSPAVGLLPAALRTRRRAGGCPPVVTTLHEYGWWRWPARVPSSWFGPGERRGWWDRETLTLVPRSVGVIVTNPGHAQVVHGRLPASSPVIVPIGANVEPAFDGSRDEARASLGVGRDEPLLVFFGFVHPVKGLRYLLPAVAELACEVPGLRLHVVGGIASLALAGEEAAEFEREVRHQIEELGLGATVTLTGWLPSGEVSRHLTAADAAVLPFTHGMTTKSGSLLTALAHGLPVVTTRSDPPDPELVDGSTVLLARPRDTPSLLAALRRVLSDTRLAARLRVAGTGIVARRSWDGVAQAHADLYARALEGA